MYAIMQWFITVGCLFLGSPPAKATREKQTTSKVKVNSKLIEQIQAKKAKSRAWAASHSSHGSNVSIAVPVLGGNKATWPLVPSVEVHTPKTKHPAPQEQVAVDDACSSDDGEAHWPAPVGSPPKLQASVHYTSHVVTPIKGNRRPPVKLKLVKTKRWRPVKLPEKVPVRRVVKSIEKNSGISLRPQVVVTQCSFSSFVPVRTDPLLSSAANRLEGENELLRERDPVTDVYGVAEVEVTGDCQNPGHTCFGCQGNGDCLFGEVGISPPASVYGGPSLDSIDQDLLLRQLNEISTTPLEPLSIVTTSSPIPFHSTLPSLPQSLQRFPLQESPEFPEDFLDIPTPPEPNVTASSPCSPVYETIDPEISFKLPTTMDVSQEMLANWDDVLDPTPKPAEKKRGRRPKSDQPQPAIEKQQEPAGEAIKKKRGRPPKVNRNTVIGSDVSPRVRVKRKKVPQAQANPATDVSSGLTVMQEHLPGATKSGDVCTDCNSMCLRNLKVRLTKLRVSDTNASIKVGMMFQDNLPSIDLMQQVVDNGAQLIHKAINPGKSKTPEQVPPTEQHPVTMAPLPTATMASPPIPLKHSTGSSRIKGGGRVTRTARSKPVVTQNISRVTDTIFPGIQAKGVFSDMVEPPIQAIPEPGCPKQSTPASDQCFGRIPPMLATCHSNDQFFPPIEASPGISSPMMTPSRATALPCNPQTTVVTDIHGEEVEVQVVSGIESELDTSFCPEGVDMDNPVMFSAATTPNSQACMEDVPDASSLQEQQAVNMATSTPSATAAAATSSCHIPEVGKELIIRLVTRPKTTSGIQSASTSQEKSPPGNEVVSDKSEDTERHADSMPVKPLQQPAVCRQIPARRRSPESCPNNNILEGIEREEDFEPDYLEDDHESRNSSGSSLHSLDGSYPEEDSSAESSSDDPLKAVDAGLEDQEEGAQHIMHKFLSSHMSQEEISSISSIQLELKPFVGLFEKFQQQQILDNPDSSKSSRPESRPRSPVDSSDSNMSGSSLASKDTSLDNQQVESKLSTPSKSPQTRSENTAVIKGSPQHIQCPTKSDDLGADSGMLQFTEVQTNEPSMEHVAPFVKPKESAITKILPSWYSSLLDSMDSVGSGVALPDEPTQPTCFKSTPTVVLPVEGSGEVDTSIAKGNRSMLASGDKPSLKVAVQAPGSGSVGHQVSKEEKPLMVPGSEESSGSVAHRTSSNMTKILPEWYASVLHSPDSERHSKTKEIPLSLGHVDRDSVSQAARTDLHENKESEAPKTSSACIDHRVEQYNVLGPILAALRSSNNEVESQPTRSEAQATPVSQASPHSSSQARIHGRSPARPTCTAVSAQTATTDVTTATGSRQTSSATVQQLSDMSTVNTTASNISPVSSAATVVTTAAVSGNISSSVAVSGVSATTCTTVATTIMTVPTTAAGVAIATVAASQTSPRSAFPSETVFQMSTPHTSATVLGTAGDVVDAPPDTEERLAISSSEKKAHAEVVKIPEEIKAPSAKSVSSVTPEVRASSCTVATTVAVATTASPTSLVEICSTVTSPTQKNVRSALSVSVKYIRLKDVPKGIKVCKKDRMLCKRAIRRHRLQVLKEMFGHKGPDPLLPVTLPQENEKSMIPSPGKQSADVAEPAKKPMPRAVLEAKLSPDVSAETTKSEMPAPIPDAKRQKVVKGLDQEKPKRLARPKQQKVEEQLQNAPVEPKIGRKGTERCQNKPENAKEPVLSWQSSYKIPKRKILDDQISLVKPTTSGKTAESDRKKFLSKPDKKAVISEKERKRARLDKERKTISHQKRKLERSGSVERHIKRSSTGSKSASANDRAKSGSKTETKAIQGPLPRKLDSRSRSVECHIRRSSNDSKSTVSSTGNRTPAAVADMKLEASARSAIPHMVFPWQPEPVSSTSRRSSTSTSASPMPDDASTIPIQANTVSTSVEIPPPPVGKSIGTQTARTIAIQTSPPHEEESDVSTSKTTSVGVEVSTGTNTLDSIPVAAKRTSHSVKPETSSQKLNLQKHEKASGPALQLPQQQQQKPCVAHVARASEEVMSVAPLKQTPISEKGNAFIEKTKTSVSCTTNEKSSKQKKASTSSTLGQEVSMKKMKMTVSPVPRQESSMNVTPEQTETSAPKRRKIKRPWRKTGASCATMESVDETRDTSTVVSTAPQQTEEVVLRGILHIKKQVPASLP